MKKTFFLGLLCAVSLLCSCSSEIEDKVQPEEKDFVEVGFNMCGDFLDVSDKPMTKVSEQNTYYYFRITKDMNTDHSHVVYYGHFGFFDDLSRARIQLERGVDYTIDATALVECDDKVNVDSLSKIKMTEYSNGESHYYIDIYNKFSEYLKGFSQGGGPLMDKVVDTPYYTDKSIDRYHNRINATVFSNKTIDIDLYRASYALNIEIDAPALGYVSLACEQPGFFYGVSAGENHLSSGSKIYSIGELSSKKIVVTMNYSDGGDGSSNRTISKEITVKSGIETTIRVNFDPHEAENQFNITLDKTPMAKEEVNF